MAMVGPQVSDSDPGRSRQFQADDLGGEPDGSIQVGDAGADVGDVGQRDHRACSGEDGRDVDVNLPVADQVTVVEQDVRVGDDHGLAVLAEVLDIYLHDDRVPELPHIHDVVGQPADCREEPGDGLLHGLAADGRVRVAEPEPHVGGEVSNELVRVKCVDVGEDLRYVTAHDVLPSSVISGARP